MKAILIAAYIASCVGAYGLLYGTFQENFKLIADEVRTGDRALSLICCLFGPIAILAFFVANLKMNMKIHWRLR